MKQKVVVITGASAGLGRAIALEFGKAGHSCGLISRNQSRLETLKNQIESHGSRASIGLADVANFDQLEKASDLIEKELGPIDIWVNNAMTSIFSVFQEVTPEEYKRVTEVTYLGFVYGTHLALKKMRAQGYGTIIQVGSALAYRGIPLQSAYCGAKHAIKGFTESIHCELLHENSPIKITMVQMPAFNTPQFNWVKSNLARKAQPVPPIFQPEVGAKAVYWAAFHYRREWIVGFSAQAAITMTKFIPNLLAKYLGKTGFDSQQYNGPEDRNRPNDLYKSVDGPYGAHGDFDTRAKSFSFQFWLSKHRAKVASAILLLVIIIAIATSI